MDDSPAKGPAPQNREEYLFDAAIKLTGRERTAFLDGACLGEVALRQRLEALLKAYEGPDVISPPVQSAEVPRTIEISLPQFSDDAVGTKLGRYKLLEKLGEGGFGEVYVAEQSEPVRRRVALKVIKAGMDTRQVVARFEAERQALAMMEHPNIARVLDAGATEAGRPYFVMELVRGIKITDYCDENQLSTKQRLELFIKVCRAVQHAHQKGIIHRDLKPSNILVTLHDGTPMPKVIDFGIAKATEGRLTDATVYTQLHQFMGTPAYMSPEQAEMSALDIDTRSDIYSLGVLLYELLAGCTPFDPKDLLAAGLDAMRQTIREKEPVSPSTRLAMLPQNELTTTAKRRASPAPMLIHSVKGDLDWIAMKCLEKDRQRRYETANGLALDIERYLAGEAVVAAPPNSIYKLQKFIRRNKGLVTAAVLILVSLLLGITAATLGLAQAQRQKAAAVAARRAETTQREAAETARAAAEQNARVAQENANLASQQAMTLLTGIQNIVTTAKESHPPLPTNTMEAFLNIAMKSADKVADNYDKTKTSKEATTAAIFDMLGTLYLQMGRPVDAQKRFLSLHEIVKERVKIKQGNDPSRNNLAISCRRLGGMALSVDRDPAKSLAYFREALALRQDIYEHPKHDGSEMPPWQNAVECAMAEQDVGVACMRLGSLAEARDHFERGLRLAREGSHLDPLKTEQSGQLVFSLLGVAEMRRRFGQLPEAQTLYSEALALVDGMIAREPDSVAAKMSLRSVLINMGVASSNDPPRRQELLQRAEDVARAILANQPDRADNAAALASLLLERALTLRAADPDQAARKFAESAAIRRRLAALAGQRDIEASVDLAVALAANGDVAEATELGRRLHDTVKGDSEALIELARCFAYAAAFVSGSDQEALCAQAEGLLREAVDLHFLDPVSLRFMLGDTPVMARPAVKAMLATMDAEVMAQR